MKYKNSIKGSNTLNRLYATINNDGSMGCLISKRDIKMLLEYVDEALKCRDNEIVYVCDRKACNSCSSHVGDCYHTSDIEHAKNFERRGDTYFEKENEVVYLCEGKGYDRRGNEIKQ